MIHRTSLGWCIALASILAPTLATAEIVNVDFDGSRPGDSPLAGTFVGVGAAGGGTFFNGLTADSGGGDDNLIVTGTNLLDSDGLLTDFDFTISPVAGHNEPGQSYSPDSLYDDNIFNHSAGNTAPFSGSPFTISGLGSVETADLYFYMASFNQGTFSGIGTGTTGTFNGFEAQFFDDVPVIDGSISGNFGAEGAVGVLSGFTIVTGTTGVPEPTTYMLVGLGVACVLAAARRRRNVQPK